MVLRIYLHVFLSVLLIVLICPPVTWCDVRINSTLNFGRVQAGEILNVTCVTRGSDRLAWSSDEYIGRNRLTLAVVGRLLTPNDYTNATLISSTSTGGITELVSELSIIVQPNIPSASLTCHNSVTGETQTINFSPVENPVVTIERDESREVCRGEQLGFICDSRGTNTVVWIKETKDTHDFMKITANSSLNESSSMTVQITENAFKNGIQVLRSQLNLHIAEDIPSYSRYYITCVNEELRTEFTIGIRMADNCVEVHTTPSDLENTSTMSSAAHSTSVQTTAAGGECTPGISASVNDSGSDIAVAVVLTTVILSILFIIAISVVAVLWRWYYLKSTKVLQEPAEYKVGMSVHSIEVIKVGRT